MNIARPSVMGDHQKSIQTCLSVGFPIAFLDTGKDGHIGDAVVKSALTSTTYSYNVRRREHTDQAQD